MQSTGGLSAAGDEGGNAGDADAWYERSGAIRAAATRLFELADTNMEGKVSVFNIVQTLHANADIKDDLGFNSLGKDGMHRSTSPTAPQLQPTHHVTTSPPQSRTRRRCMACSGY